MNTISADSSYAEPVPRTVGLRAALAVGAAVVAGAFGAGYALAEALDESVRVTAVVPAAAAGDTFGAALRESLLLKQPPPVRDKSSDIRYERIR
ncbi:MAG TPA: hypothetical protein VNP89_07500 [Gaiellaceae bacterium]|nr:hypothetical protein [Gaiellaceae bacterium]